MRKWPAILVAAAFGFSLWAFDRLPERMPTHWGIDGQPDDWSSRTFGALLIPIVMLLVWGLLSWIPSIDPRRANYAKFRSTYDTVVIGTLVVMLIVHMVLVGHSLGWNVPVARVVQIVAGAFLVV